ncbi:MAG: hypothetical protein ABF254_11460, partial [Octadecabacter sp.]
QSFATGSINVRLGGRVFLSSKIWRAGQVECEKVLSQVSFGVAENIWCSKEKVCCDQQRLLAHSGQVTLCADRVLILPKLAGIGAGK